MSALPVHENVRMHGALLSSEILFKPFPDGAWRVEWLGDVNFHNRQVTASQPTVNVVLRGVDARNSGEFETALVPISQYFPLSLGRVWRDKCLTSEYGPNQIDKTLKFDVAKALPCMAGVPIGLDGSGDFLLPFSEYDGHREHTKSWCLRVEVDGTQVVFPANELIRFYFGSSAGLLRKVMSANFSVRSLVNEHEMNGSRARIVLATDVSGYSAADVARIVFDPAAERAASLVSRSLVADTADGLVPRTYPKVLFPYSGMASMMVRGINIASRDGVPRFLVQEVLSCSKEFPFRGLDYVAVAKSPRQVPAGDDRGNGTRGEPATGGGSGSGVRKSTPIENKAPGKSATAKTIVWDLRVRFPDLASKPVKQVDGDTPKQALTSHLPDHPFESTGAGESSSRGKRVEPVVASDDRSRIKKLRCPVEAWSDYFDMLRHLANADWVESMSFVRLDPRQVWPHYSRVPELVDEDGAIVEVTRRLLADEQDEFTECLASFVNIRAHGRTCVLLSICPRGPSESVSLWAWPGEFLESTRALAALSKVVSDASPAGGYRFLLGSSDTGRHLGVESAVLALARAIDLNPGL